MLSSPRTCRAFLKISFRFTRKAQRCRTVTARTKWHSASVHTTTKNAAPNWWYLHPFTTDSLNNFLAILYQHSSFLTWKSSTAILALSLFWPEMETCQNMQEYCEWGVLKSPLGLQTHFYTRSEHGCEPRCLEIDYCINLLCHLSAFTTNSCYISSTRLHFASATWWQKQGCNTNLF